MEEQEDQKNGGGQRSSKSASNPEIPTFKEEVRIPSLPQGVNREPDPIRPKTSDDGTSANTLAPKAALEEGNVPGRQRGIGPEPNTEIPDSNNVKTHTRWRGTMIDAGGGAGIEDIADLEETKGGTEEPDHTEDPRKAVQRGDDRGAGTEDDPEVRRLGEEDLVGRGRLRDVLGKEEQAHGVK